MEKLIEKIANSVVDWCYGKNEIVSENQREILVYGYTLFLGSVIKTIVILFLAICTHTLFKTIIIIGSFGLLRNYAGGIHCKTELGCTFCMIGVWAIGLLVSFVNIPVVVSAIMAVIIVLTIILYAPRSTKNNPLRNKKVWKQKRVCSICIMALFILASAITGIVFKKQEVMNMILTSMFIEVFSILLLVEKEGEEHEEEFKRENC